MSQTLYDKLWNSHVIHTEEDGTSILYIDRHLLHEVTSPQAFEGLKLAERPVWRISANLAVSDHNVPTTDRSHGIADPISKLQVDTLDANCDSFGITQFKMNDLRQGIVHIIGPEQGATLPGMTIVCGDSHTSTHGAFGALAHGIGTSEVEHVLATQTLLQKKSKNMLVKVEGQLPRGCTAKDIVLAIIGKIGTAGGTGYAIEFGGSTIRALSMEGRMTVCNMAIEAGARAGMVAVDDTTINYLKDRPYSPQGAEFQQAAEYWRTFTSDADAQFDRVVELNAAEIVPQVTWGTSPEMVTSIDGRVPDPEREKDPVKRDAHGTRAAIHGAAAEHADRIDQAGQDLHRLVHERAYRGLARGRLRREDAGAPRRAEHPARDGRAGLGAGESASRARRTRQGLHRRRLRMARAGLLDVSRDERRPAGAGRALRVHFESQFRRASGRGRTHAPREPGDGGGRGDRRAFRRYPQARMTSRRAQREMKRIALLSGIALRSGGVQYGPRLRRGHAASRQFDQQQGVEVSGFAATSNTQTGRASWKNSLFTAASWRRWIAKTSIRTRSFRSSS